MKTITICSSAAFYEQVITLRTELDAMGYTVIVPQIADVMAERSDFEVMHYKTWYGNADDYDKKAQLIRDHFDRIAESDAILVTNYEKHGVPNYIGGNVLMEMALAFYLKKPIFLLNSVPEDSSFYEEIRGMFAVPLEGIIARLHELFPA